MNYGRAVSALRKSWTAYRIAGRNGEPRADLALRIVRIQSALGIEKSVFPELQGMEMHDEELSEEEIELRKEEKQENGGDWSFNFATRVVSSTCKYTVSVCARKITRVKVIAIVGASITELPVKIVSDCKVV
jgi:hypothetical protein